MAPTEVERRLKRSPEARRVKRLHGRKQRDIRQVLHTRVRSQAWECVRVPLQRGSVAEHGCHAREKAIEDEKLAPPLQISSAARRGAQMLVKPLPEGLRRRVHTWRHPAMPPKGPSALSTFPSSRFVTIPRLSASRAP